MRGGSVLGREAILNLLQQFRTQLDIARLVDPVHVTEGEGRHVAAVLAEAEGLNRGDSILERRIEMLVDVVAYTVFFTADHADFYLKDGIDVLHAGEQGLRNRQVLLQWNGRAVPHMRLEDGVSTGPNLGLGRLDQRDNEAVEGILRTVVGVQRDGDSVVLGSLGGEGGEGDGTGCARLDALPGEVVRASSRHLQDAVGAGFGQTLQHGVHRLRRRDVDRGVGESLRLGLVEHFCVLLGGCDGHYISSEILRLDSPEFVTNGRALGCG